MNVGNLSNKSSSTNNSTGSVSVSLETHRMNMTGMSMTPINMNMKGMAVMTRNSSNISNVYFDILTHLERGIQTVENQVPRELMKVMNEGMIKITLEFCGFDIENEAKFNPLYTQLEQLLK